MRDNLIYSDWKKELAIWCSFTELAVKRQGPAIFLTLKGKARETVLAEVPATDINSDDGVKKITASLDNLYVKDESDSAYIAYEHFSRFRRPRSMPISDFMIEFNLRLCNIRAHAMDLPPGVLAYYLLNCANLSSDQKALCRATCRTFTYKDMKAQIERVSPNTDSQQNSTEQLSIEPQYVTENEEYPDCYDDEYEEEEQQNSNFEDTYYNGPNAWPNHSTAPQANQQPRFTRRTQRNPADDYGNPTPCRFCKSIYHWVDQCPDAPSPVRYRGARGYARRGLRFPLRSRNRGAAHGSFNIQKQF